mgnify:CR=1 FL=1
MGKAARGGLFPVSDGWLVPDGAAVLARVGPGFQKAVGINADRLRSADRAVRHNDGMAAFDKVGAHRFVVTPFDLKLADVGE